MGPQYIDRCVLTFYNTVLTLNNPLENILGKGENVGNQHFLLFPQHAVYPSQNKLQVLSQIYMYLSFTCAVIWVNLKFCDFVWFCIGTDSCIKEQVVKKQHIFLLLLVFQAVVLFANSKGFSNESFELIAHFPVRQLSQLDFDSTLKEIGLHAQETIFVQARTWLSVYFKCSCFFSSTGQRPTWPVGLCYGFVSFDQACMRP